ncbi:TPR-like protein [Peniophora sp. CONT]|nr:TPR-like protein [Peniophora sp. CONT]
MHEGHPQRLMLLCDLGGLLVYRFQNLWELNDIERAIILERQVLDLTPEGDSTRPIQLEALAVYLALRFNRLGETRDLEDAIAMYKQALNLTPESDLRWPMLLGNFAHSSWTRFKSIGDVHDLEDAIAIGKQALDLTPENHPERPMRLVNLANSLWSRFNRLGDIEDIEAAIATHKQALDLMPEDHLVRPIELGNLASSLRSRFDRLGDIHDLEAAIATQKQALDLIPEGQPERPIRLGNLANFLWFRFDHLGDIQDLEAAIAIQKQALDLMPEGHPERPMRLGNLANSLWTRFHRLGDIQDLEAAIAINKQALDLMPESHPERPKQLGNLALSLRSRFNRLGDVHNLEEAIATDTLAFELMPKGHANRPRRLYGLGLSLKARFEHIQSKVHFDAVVHSLMEASMQSVGDPTTRLKSAQECVLLLSKYPEFSSAELVLAAHSSIIQIFPEIVWLGHSVERRYEETARLGNLVNTAISAFIRLQSCYQAIEWMEAGRTLVWLQMSSLREPLDELEKEHPDLAKDLRHVSLALQRSSSASQATLDEHECSQNDVPTAAVPAVLRGVTSNTASNRHRQHAIEYQRILKDVRNRPGFENFLRAPKIEALMPSIELLDGPVVFINIHSSSCDALVLFPNGAIRRVVLSDITESGAQTLHATWMKFLRSSDLRSRGAVSVDRLISKSRTNMLGLVLERLWTWIVQPILEALHLIESDPLDSHHLRHITWCPTGPLTQLPLHAAGIYDFKHVNRPHVFDFVVSSYTPSLSALLRCHKQPGASSPHPNVLVVAQPNTPGFAVLPNTRDECKRLRAVMPRHAHTFLVHDRGTVANTLAAMKQHPWVHLACHGMQNTSNPTQSAFALYDQPLTLSTLMGAVAENAELAFLSACQTAAGDEKIPEESAHLAAGMISLGFKGVIGTMWSIGDADAPIVVEAYYKKLLELRSSGTLAQGYTGAAYALHEAVKVLREQVGEQNFVKWAPFVHFGV